MPVHVPREIRRSTRHIAHRTRQELRHLAFQRVRRDRGANYPCTRGELYDAITPDHHPPRSCVSPSQAAYEVYAHNRRGRNLGQAEYDAVRRLERATLDVYEARVDFTPDLILKAFCDLDQVFFLGFLRRNVYVDWRSASSFPPPHPRRLTMGHTETLDRGKAVIHLNADGIFANTGMTPFVEMWRTTLHEMCHAYIVTQTDEEFWAEGRHTRFFGTIIRAVDERARRDIHVAALHNGEIYEEISFSSSSRR